MVYAVFGALILIKPARLSCTVQRQGQAKVRYYPNSGHRAACRYRDRRLTFM